jgi:hypothetical protein
MADYMVRPNMLLHVRQSIKYVMPFWGNGMDVCPGVIYLRPSLSAERKSEIEDTLDKHSIQAVWASERGQDYGLKQVQAYQVKKAVPTTSGRPFCSIC